jgi:VanZ family protein
MLKAARIVAWLLGLAIIVLSVVPAWLLPNTGIRVNFEHFGVFAAAGFVFGLAYAQRYGLIVICLVIFGGATETIQLFVPGRHARLSDFVADALGVLYGAVAARTIARGD